MNSPTTNINQFNILHPAKSSIIGYFSNFVSWL